MMIMQMLNVRFLCIALSLLVSASAFSAPNANDIQRFNSFYKYALISNAAYQGRGNVEKVLAGSGYTISKQGEVPGYYVGYFLATNHKLKKHVLAVRGTSNVENAMVDIALKLLTNKHTGVKLNQGFALTAEFIENKLNA